MCVDSKRKFGIYARKLFHGLYYYAKFLGIINCRYDEDAKKVRHVQHSSKWVARIVRLIFLLIYMGAFSNLLEKLGATSKDDLVGGFNFLLMVSIWIFAFFVFIVQIHDEAAIIEVINNFMQLYRRVAQRNGIEAYSMLNRKFLIIFLLKLLITCAGYLNDVPTLLKVKENFIDNLIILDYVSAWIGVYLWIGSMFVLDVCVLGLLIIALLYEQMGIFLKRLLEKMSILEENEENLVSNTIGRWSNHRRMKLLCECADIIVDCDAIYAELYRLTKTFQNLLQWQILYYIYYNFMVVLLTCHICIWGYLHSDGYIDKWNLFIVFVKIGNLAFLALCADLVGQRAYVPQLLCLDIVCSDMDDRWCMSVETFLSRRQTERLEITVLGFFQLNNEFILLILSAIISYLFITIQFGLSDKTTKYSDSHIINDTTI